MPNFAELTLNHGRDGAIADVVADSTALAALRRFRGRIVDFDDGDYGKFVVQLDTLQIWCLTSIIPIYWTPVTGAGVDPTTLHNAIVAALGTDYVKRDGTLAMTGALNAGGNKFTNGAAATAATDFVIKSQVPTSIDDLTPSFSVASFILSGSGYAAVVEVGTTVTLAAAATYVSGPPIAPTTITDTDSGSWSFSTPFASSTRTGSVQKTTNNASLTVTLTATKPNGSSTVTAASAISWQPRVYHGPATPGTYNAAFILALASYNLQPSRACTFTDTMGSGQYDYYAAPSSYGTPTFQYGVLPGGWSIAASGVSVTHNGVTQTYDLWVTNQPDLGSTTWTVT